MAEAPINGAVTKEPLASHHRVQAQRKEVRGQWLMVAPAQTLPLLQLPEPRQREGPWSSSTEGQAPRGRGAPKQGRFTSPQCI